MYRFVEAGIIDRRIQQEFATIDRQANQRRPFGVASASLVVAVIASIFWFTGIVGE
jgi:hypothetical protein